MGRPVHRRRSRFGALLVWVLTAGAADAEDPPTDERALLSRSDQRITQEDRQHWAFRPVRSPQVPEVRDPAWVRNPIDAFILARLEGRGWGPAPPAEPAALLRR